MRKRVAERGAKATDSKVAKPARIARETDVLPNKSRWWVWIKRGFLALCIFYVSVPFLLRIFPGILRHMIYSHKIRVPFFVDLSRPTDLSLNHTVNMYLTPEEGVTLGVWHTVPDSQWQEAQGKDLEWYQASLGDGVPIIIYLHGNAGTRGAGHRVGLLNVLSAAGFHVLSLDYRGFGESTGEPTEAGLTTDTLHLYQWVTARSGSSRVCLWGHSLGTGVATNTAVKLQEQGVLVDAVILEAAYTNIRQEGAHHPFGWFYWKFPGFEYFFLDTIAENNVIFPNDENLKKMKTPLLFLHAEDDHIVPFHMSQELYNIARSAQNSEDRVKLVPFSGSLGYLHNGIYRDPRLPSIIRQFVQSLTP